ncbi:MAG: alpha/beta hydrolase [Nitrospinae bacterium]|nr:alpha/beta hydrolase [Nitrospinota bacterium]
MKINGNTATCYSYVRGVHSLPYAEGGGLWDVYGTYDHELVKTPSGWKVSKMVFHLLYQEGNKNLPVIAMKMPDEQRVSFISEGNKLIGIIYIPSGYKEGQKLPAVIVTGSWTTVKEQMAGTYAKKLAAEGFAALVFDFRGFGESGGEPRQYESPQRKIQDIKNAVTFLQTLPMIDKNKMGGLGICASSGYMSRAVTEDRRIKTFAAIAPWLHNADLVKLIYGGEKGVSEKIAIGKAASGKYEQTKINDFVPACSISDDSAAMFGNFEYYLNPARGAIPQWKNQFAVMSWHEWLQFDPIKEAGMISVPTLLIHSNDAAIPDGAKQFYEKLFSKKDFYWMKGTQFDFYDNPPTVNEASKKAVQWFKQYLEQEQTK